MSAVLHWLGGSLIGLSGAFPWIARRLLDLLGRRRVLILTFAGVLMLSGGGPAAHALGADRLSPAWWGIAAALAAALGALGLGAIGVVLVWRKLARLPLRQPVRFTEINRRSRRKEKEAEHQTSLRELDAARRDLETRVEERTRELSLVKARLETALRGAYVHAFSQDCDLRYTWVYDPDSADAAAAMLGRTDDDILPDDAKAEVIACKRRVLATGQPETCELASLDPRKRALYSLHIEPAFGVDGRVEGLTGAAIDITRIRSLESEQQRLADELRSALQRYEIALRGSQVTLYTQDRESRFTSISNPLFGREVAEIVGRTEAEILPAESREQFAALARAALATGRAQDGEVSVKEAEKTRWYALHVEPLPAERGSIVGVTCALFDITERKTSESHLRLLMRELTHRSKNLLAVIQSMARQSARHAGTIDDFLDNFGARLQAIATSHDLLVQEGWYGASLHDLTRRQLAKYLDGTGERIKLSGPAVHLKPAAAQSFGLALHELASNAERFGALSVPQGSVEIHWRQLQAAEAGDTDGVEIVWTEQGGPDVAAPISRGFGSLVVEKNLSRALNADVALTFEPTGVRCRMLIPASHLLAAR